MNWKPTARVWRRRLYEAVRSSKHSRPALFDMDTQLLEYLPERGGIFVEAGANDGFNQSNTYFFERFRGWSGVLVEPVPALAAKAKLLRRRSTVFNCALVAAEHTEGEVAMIHSDLMSLVKGAKGSPEEDLAWAERGHSLHGQPVYEFSAPARTLSSVLDEAATDRIDLLSLDVEGFELEVLGGLDFARHAPRFLLIELTDDVRADRMREFLAAARYEEVTMLSVHDHLFRRVNPL